MKQNMIQFNAVYFIQPTITNYEFASEGLTICTHTTSLSQDPTSEKEKIPRNRKKTFTGKQREETFREATEEDPSPRVDRRCHVYRMKSITELHKHIQ